MSPTALIPALSILAIAGCGGEDTASGAGTKDLGDCTASVTLSGGVEAALSHDNSWACGIPFGGDTGVWMIFLAIDAPIVDFSVSVDDVHAGEIGTFPAYASVRLEDERTWATEQDACSVVVLENSFQSQDEMTKEYLFTGHGTCASPAEIGDGMDEPVTIGEFAFRFPSRWFL